MRERLQILLIMVQVEYLVITCLDQMVDWQFTQGGNLFVTDSEQDFISAIVSALNFKGMVYLSRSNKSELEQWEGGTL